VTCVKRRRDLTYIFLTEVVSGAISVAMLLTSRRHSYCLDLVLLTSKDPHTCIYIPMLARYRGWTGGFLIQA
jgi:hypothetical protein